MIQKEEIVKYLQELNDELGAQAIKGEICLYGGAVMCVVYDARPSTRDVDAVFKPAEIIRDIAGNLAEKYNLRRDWLNDGVKGFLVAHPQQVIFNWPSLKVYAAEPDYLLAMKALAARIDTTDKADLIFLIKQLKLTSAEEVFAILEQYYPHQRIKPATQFFIEEIFETW